MNSFKKLLWIVIFLVLISNVFGRKCIVKGTASRNTMNSDTSTGDKAIANDNNIRCTSQGGTCMNPNSCGGTVKSGLCPGGEDNKCCITENVGSTTNANSKCTSQGGTCMNPNSCDGTVKSGLCPGGEDNKCCITDENEQTGDYSTISDLGDALRHYNEGTGETVVPSQELIDEMKNDPSFTGLIEELRWIIRGKITDQKIKTEEIIENQYGSYRTLNCETLGEYEVDVEYSFSASKSNLIVIHFSGVKQWDKNSPEFMIVGMVDQEPGVPFDVKYHFTYDMVIDLTISDIIEAIKHYRSKSGATVAASSKLIEQEIKGGSIVAELMPQYRTFNDMIEELKGDIENKITDFEIENEIHVANAPGSTKGRLWCLTIGSYSVNVEYSFIPKEGINYVDVHFTGSNMWDFETVNQQGNLYNIIEEEIPSMIAGDGVPYLVTYDFYHTVEIDTRNFLEKLFDL